MMPLMPKAAGCMPKISWISGARRPLAVAAPGFDGGTNGL